jgi:hypothetical protein
MMLVAHPLAPQQLSAALGSSDQEPPPTAPPSPIEPNQDWEKVWKGAWGGMARTDPDAHWLYQGWAIRGEPAVSILESVHID